MTDLAGVAREAAARATGWRQGIEHAAEMADCSGPVTGYEIRMLLCPLDEIEVEETVVYGRFSVIVCRKAEPT
jgi:hypothetical protein